MKRITLTQGKYATVDERDYKNLIRHKWHAVHKRNTWYAAGYVNGKHTFMHRYLLKAPRGKMVDHIDGNGLNNQRENLRYCTYQGNRINSKKTQGHRTSKYKGVYRHKCQKWYACIKHNYKTYHLGSFDSEIDAARAYDDKAVELFGEYARVNTYY